MTAPNPADDSIAVLVVEDESLIRENLVETLSDAGFDVHQAGHSGEALEFLERRSDAIHVLFTDVNMPGSMDGIALAHHASREWPAIALLVTSALPQPAGRAPPSGCKFVGKPYLTSHVIGHIRALARA